MLLRYKLLIIYFRLTKAIDEFFSKNDYKIARWKRKSSQEIVDLFQSALTFCFSNVFILFRMHKTVQIQQRQPRQQQQSCYPNWRLPRAARGQLPLPQTFRLSNRPDHREEPCRHSPSHHQVC